MNMSSASLLLMLLVQDRGVYHQILLNACLLHVNTYTFYQHQPTIKPNLTIEKFPIEKYLAKIFLIFIGILYNNRKSQHNLRIPIILFIIC